MCELAGLLTVVDRGQKMPRAYRVCRQCHHEPCVRNTTGFSNIPQSHWCPWQSPALARCKPRRALPRSPRPLAARRRGGASSTKTAGATLKLRAGEENRPVGRSAIEKPQAKGSKRKTACKRPSPSATPQGVCAGGSCGRKGALLWHRDALRTSTRRHHASHAAGGRR